MIDIGIKQLRSMGKLNRKTGIVRSKLRKLLSDHRSITCQIARAKAGIVDVYNGNAFPESTWRRLRAMPSLRADLRSAGACKYFCAQILTGPPESRHRNYGKKKSGRLLMKLSLPLHIILHSVIRQSTFSFC